MALLRLATIERLPKAVTLGPQFKSASLTAADSEQLLDLIEAIESGSTLSPRLYRRRRNDTPDRLLADEAIMHLHLGGQDSDTLVYLMQFEHEVVLLAIAGHVYLQPEKRPALKVMSEAEKRRAVLRDKLKVDEVAKAESARQQDHAAKLKASLATLKKPPK